jgi:hypothetical protein
VTWAGAVELVVLDLLLEVGGAGTATLETTVVK